MSYYFIYVMVYMLDICRLLKKQDLTRKLWWNFFVRSVFLFFLCVLPLPILFLSLLFGMSSNSCVNPLFQLIRRRYFSDDLSAQTPWSISSVQRVSHRLDEDLSDEDQSYKNTRYSLPSTYNFWFVFNSKLVYTTITIIIVVSRIILCWSMLD